MGRFRVYIKPFEPDGEYASDFTEVSSDVLKIGEISQSLDNTTYDIGIFKSSGVQVTFRNDHGLYGEADSLKSIFKYKRSDSIIKITWDARRYSLKCGFFKADAGVLGGEQEIFRGLLYDTSAVSSIDDQKISFRFAGFDSLLDRVLTPYSSITNGDDFSEVIYTMLNQSEITTHLTISPGNINPEIDLAIDDKSETENKTVKDVLDGGKLLLASNSVLYIENQAVYVSNRDESASDMFTFYGQASINGNENIVGIKDYRDGLNKVFNHITWPETSLKSQDTGSISKYGIRKQETSCSLISSASTAKIQSVLDSIKSEFAEPKREFELEAPIIYETLALNLKDKVVVDYPTPFKSADENPIPRYGQVAYGEVVFPIGQFSLTIESTARFKILGKRINPTNETIVFQLREV